MRMAEVLLLLFPMGILGAPLMFVCGSTNDLYALVSKQVATVRYTELADALQHGTGSVLFVLAESYPTPSQVTVEQWGKIQESNLTVFAEFVACLPDGDCGAVATSQWERVVVTSDLLLPSFKKLSIFNTHKGTSFLKYNGVKAHDLAFARVAGYNTAVDGLPDAAKVSAALFKVSPNILMASSKFSDAITARLMPSEAWKSVLQHVLQFVGQGSVVVDWQPTVRASYDGNSTLPTDAQRKAIIRGVEFYNRSLLMPSVDQLAGFAKACSSGAWPVPHSTSSRGEMGILEGFTSDVSRDGSQGQACGYRADCNAESAMAWAARGVLEGSPADLEVARNLISYAWAHSGWRQTWAPPRGHGDTFGLIAWESSGTAFDKFYKDDDARGLLGGLALSGLMGDTRWHDVLATATLANLRITGVKGFGPSAETFANIVASGWRSYYNTDYSKQGGVYSPHYQSYIWAVYLWGYSVSNYPPLLERAQSAITLMMQSYPSKWIPTSNGITMQRARILLPLAWLVRVNDTDTHRQWLETAVRDLLKRQHPCGAIQEEVSAPGWHAATRVPTNADYGTFEAPLNQENTDPVSDLLYTSNFALLGLHEAAAVLEDAAVAQAEDALAAFLVRIQASSSDRPELDGAFFRAFDFDKWEVWASDADVGWGAWSIETGWTQSWITTVLAMREMKVSLWELGRRVNARASFNEWIPFMFPKSHRPCLNASGPGVSYTITTMVHSLCAPAKDGGPVQVTYTGTVCDGKKILWSKMASAPPYENPHLTPADCAWTSAKEPEAWRAQWTGACGVGPTAVEDLPEQLC